MGTALIKFSMYIIICLVIIGVGREISDSWWSGWFAGVIAIALMQVAEVIYNNWGKKDPGEDWKEGYQPTSDVATPNDPPKESGLGEERKTKLVKVTDEEGRIEIYQVPEDFYREILETYGDFQEFFDCATDHDQSFYSEEEYIQAHGLCYDDSDVTGKTSLMGCPMIRVDTEIVESNG